MAASATAGRRLRLAAGAPFAALTAQVPPPPAGDLFLAPAPARESPPEATATLGALYQEQGHTADAERVYRDVLVQEPDNARAREGLAALAGRRHEAPAGPVLVAAPAGGKDRGADRLRRIAALRDYLARIRRGREAAAR